MDIVDYMGNPLRVGSFIAMERKRIVYDVMEQLYPVGLIHKITCTAWSKGKFTNKPIYRLIYKTVNIPDTATGKVRNYASSVSSKDGRFLTVKAMGEYVG